MEATFRALREHGYADLTISKIADEFPKSKSLLYYHYDSKDDLLAAFLGFAGDRFLSVVDAGADDDPVANLRALFDRLLPETLDEEMRAGQAIMLELRVQALTDASYRAAFGEMDDRLHGRIREYLREAIGTGRVRPVDPDETATELLAVVTGAMVARATTDRDVVGPTRAALDRRIDGLLMGEDAAGAADRRSESSSGDAG